MPYCINCGAEVKGDERFCSTCGHPLESKIADVNRPARKRQKSSKVLWVIAALAIVSVAALILVLGVPWKDVEVSGELTIADETQPSELVLGDGTTAVVPPGSLPTGATIVMSRLDASEAPTLPEGFSRAELIYDISADQPLKKAVTLRILMPEVADESILLFSRYHNGQWEPVPFVAEDGFAIVETDTLSLWAWLNMQVGKLSERADEAIMTYTNTDRYIDWYEEVTGLAKYMQLPLENSSEHIGYDDSKARGLISASARIVDDDQIRLRVHNETKFYLQISFDGPTSVEPKRGAYIDANTVRLFVNTMMIPPIAIDIEDVILLPEGTAEFLTDYTPDQPLKISTRFSNVAAIFSSLDPALGLVPIVDIEMVVAIRDTLGQGSEFVRALPDIEMGWSRRALELLDVVEATSRMGVLAGEKAIRTLANMLIIPAAVDIREKYLEGRAIDIIDKGADAILGGTITISYLAETGLSPGEVVEKLYFLASERKYAEAERLMSPNAVKWLQSEYGSMEAAWRETENHLAGRKILRVEILNEKISNGQASLDAVVYFYDGSQVTDTDIFLEKINNTWLVTFEEELTGRGESSPALTPAPATIYVPNDYPSIQAAVNAASSGDIIVVRDGTYTENIDITKDRLTIQSQNGARATIVQAANQDDHVFGIAANGITLSGFTVVGGGPQAEYPNFPAGISLGDIDTATKISPGPKATHSTISNNILLNNFYGIRLVRSDNNTIANNIVENNVDGINLYAFNENNTLANNTVSGNSRSGIYLRAKNNVLTGNNISNNEQGIFLEDANNNVIYLNNFMGNTNNVALLRSTSTWNSPEQMTYTYKGQIYIRYLGNYWSDYSGSDTNSDGIGDMPQKINSGRDYYPLMKPWEDYDG